MREHPWATPFLLLALGVAFAAVFSRVQPMVFGDTHMKPLAHQPALQGIRRLGHPRRNDHEARLRGEPDRLELAHIRWELDRGEVDGLDLVPGAAAYDELPGLDREVDAFDDVEGAEALANVGQANIGHGSNLS